MNQSINPPKQKNLAIATTFGVAYGATIGLMLDAITHSSIEHVHKTFSKPYIPTDQSIYLGITRDTADKAILLGSVALGAILGGIREYSKAKAQNDKHKKSWKEQIESEQANKTKSSISP